MTTDPEGRPAPRYGEYATPEQQQERMRISPEDGATAPGALSDSPPPAPFAASSFVAGTSEMRPRRGDRFVTIALLAYGLFTVITTVPQLFDYAAFAQVWLDYAGIDGEFTATDTARTWGMVGGVVFVAGWMITAWLSWRVLRRGRLSWWIPLVGAVVTFVVVSLCLSVPLMSDPAIVDQLVRSGRDG